MGNLANSFENLTEEHQEKVRLSQVNFEDIDLEDVLEMGLETLTEKSKQLDMIDAKIIALEAGDPEAAFSLESLDDEILDLFDTPTLDSLGFESLDDISMEEKVGGVTGILQRMWQVYFLDFLTTFDWLADLVKSSSKRLGKYRDRIKDTRRLFADKKPNLDQDKQKASYAQLHNYWMNEDGFIKQPFKQLDEEEKLANYVLFDYPKLIEKEMGDLSTIAKRADLETPESFEKTVVSPLERKKHPVELFDKGKLGGRPYILHTGLKVSGKRSDGNALAKLGASRKVKVSKRPLLATGNALIPHVIPDVEMSNNEIDDLIMRGDDFLDMTERFLKETDQMKRVIGSLKGGLEVMMKDAKKTDNESLKSDMKSVGRYAKTLVDCYWAPSVKMSKRNIDITKGIAYLAGRLVAHAK